MRTRPHTTMPPCALAPCVGRGAAAAPVADASVPTWWCSLARQARPAVLRGAQHGTRTAGTPCTTEWSGQLCHRQPRRQRGGLAVQPLESWPRAVGDAQAGDVWGVDVLPPAAASPETGYGGMGWWVPGGSRCWWRARHAAKDAIARVSRSFDRWTDHRARDRRRNCIAAVPALAGRGLEAADAEPALITAQITPVRRGPTAACSGAHQVLRLGRGHIA